MAGDKYRTSDDGTATELNWKDNKPKTINCKPLIIITIIVVLSIIGWFIYIQNTDNNQGKVIYSGTTTDWEAVENILNSTVIQFSFSTNIENEKPIKDLEKLMKNHPDLKIELKGHADRETIIINEKKAVKKTIKEEDKEGQISIKIIWEMIFKSKEEIEAERKEKEKQQEAININVSQSRANYVRSQLINAGIEEARIKINGVGSSELIPDIPQNSSKHRRVTVKRLK